MRRLRRLVLFLVATVLLVPFVMVVVYRFVDPPLTPLMLVRLAQGHGIEHRPVPLAEVAPVLRAAVVAAEDNHFCTHGGYDWAALRGELQTWAEGGRPRGASTITMQTAKNLFLWPGRDPVRKALEAWLTWQIETVWPKQRILEVYLGVVELGPGIYGVEAAARRLFGKHASALLPDEAARLAAVLPAPLTWSAAPPGPYVQRRARVIRTRVAQLGPLLECTR